MSKFLDKAKARASKKVVPFEVEGEKFEARELTQAHFEILAINYAEGVSINAALVALSIYNSKGKPEFGIKAYQDIVDNWGPIFEPFAKAAMEANEALTLEADDAKKP